MSDDYYLPDECIDCEEYNTCSFLTKDGGKTILCQKGCNDAEKAGRFGIFLKCKKIGDEV